MDDIHGSRSEYARFPHWLLLVRLSIRQVADYFPTPSLTNHTLSLYLYRYGRLSMFFASSVGMVVTGVGASFSVNLHMLTIIRLFFGIFAAGARNSSYVYGTYNGNAIPNHVNVILSVLTSIPQLLKS